MRGGLRRTMADLATLWAAAAPLALVAGGTIAATLFACPLADVRRAMAGARAIFTADAQRDATLAYCAMRQIDQLCAARGVSAAERVHTPLAYVAQCAVALSNAADSAAFARDAHRALEAWRSDAAAAQQVWTTAADAAPAMGMVGTVIGLMQLFAAGGNTAAMAGGMAGALTTTLAGLAIANVVAAPLAARLARFDEQTARWRGAVIDHLAACAAHDAGSAATPRLAAVR